MQIKINQVVVPAMVGTSITLTLDESLDSGEMLIPFVSDPSIYKRWDEVEITDDGVSIHFLIGTISTRLISKFPEVYEVEIALIEYTKKLERSIIDTSVFTQPGTISSRPVLMLGDAIELLIKRVSFQKNSLFNVDFALDSLTLVALNEFVAPEAQYNSKTLRQGIDDLLKSVGAISKLKPVDMGQENYQDIIFIDKFNKLKSRIQNFNAHNMDKTENLNEYATHAAIDVSNGISNTNSVIYPNINFWALPRDSEQDGILDTGKLLFPVNQRIYKITKFEVMIDIQIVVGQGIETLTDTELDMTDFVYDERKWAFLPSSSPGYLKEDIFNNLRTKGNTIYFKQGNKQIEGLSTFVGGEPPFYSETVLMRAMKTAANNYCNDNSYQFDDVLTDEKNVFYRVQYESMIDNGNIVLRRDDLTEINRESTLFINQQDKIVDLSELGRNIQGQINRIGLAPTRYEVLHSTFGDVYNLGDYTEQGIITEASYQFDEDFVKGTYTLTKNFNRISEFIGVDKTYRPFDILAADSSRKRTVNYTDYLYITSDGATAGNTSILTSYGIEQIKKKYTGMVSDSVTGVLMKTITSSLQTVPILCNTSDTAFGNSVVINFGFDSPLVAGFKRENISGESTIGTAPVVYVDDEGLAEEFWVQGLGALSLPANSAERTLIAEDLPEYSQPISNLLFDNSSDWFQLFKDPSEILSFNYILKMSKQNESIILGSLLTDDFGLIKPEAGVLVLYRSTEFYDESDYNAAKGTVTLFDGIVADTPSGFRIDVDPADLVGYNSWAIGNLNGEFFVAQNAEGSLRNIFFFNFSDTDNTIQDL